MPDSVYSFFVLPDGAYLEATKPVPLSRYPEGTQAVERRPDAWATWDGSQWVPGSAPSLTPEQLDAIAVRVADELLEQDAKMKALGLVMADLVEQAFNVTPEVARNQVKSRFLTYYRSLIG